MEQVNIENQPAIVSLPKGKDNTPTISAKSLRQLLKRTKREGIIILLFDNDFSSLESFCLTKPIPMSKEKSEIMKMYIRSLRDGCIKGISDRIVELTEKMKALIPPQFVPSLAVDEAPTREPNVSKVDLSRDEVITGVATNT
jgi:hypothetical protein